MTRRKFLKQVLGYAVKQLRGGMINGGRPEGNWFCQAIHYVPHAPEKLRWLKILKKKMTNIYIFANI